MIYIATLIFAALFVAAGAFMLIGWGRQRMLASALIAAGSVSVFGVAIAALSGTIFRQYGWTMFVLLPVAMGFLAVLVFGYDRPLRVTDAVWVSLLTVTVTGVGLLSFGIEGLICLVMAIPLAGP